MIKQKNIFSLIRLLPFLIGMSGLSFCAQPLAPIGGEKDEQGPLVDTTKSTPNFQTRFEKQAILLTFDEWVVLKNITEQVIESPALEFKPEIRTKGKTVIYEFSDQEVLAPNTTYTINFGEAIQDLTEGNPAEELRFIFSTGDFIDSLEISGFLVDVLNNEPIEDGLFILYENLSDTVVRTDRPFYFGKTDEEGFFRIQNIKEGIYKGFALKEEGFGNKKYDQVEEKIGFPNTFLTIHDTNTIQLNLKLFQEELPLRVNARTNEQYGLLKITFNRPPDDFQTAYQEIGQTIHYFETDQDTLKVWYTQDSLEQWAFYIRQDSLFQDTLQVTKTDKSNARPFTFLGASNTRTVRINPDKPRTFEFNNPVARFDTSQIRLLEDTLFNPVQGNWTLDTLNPRIITLKYEWIEEMPYRLELLPGAIIDLFDQPNTDTILNKYNVDPRKSYGSINATISGFHPDTSYIVELFQKTSLIESFQVAGDTIVQKTFSALKPGNYNFHVTTDYDQNGQWSTGNYDAKTQPEPVFIKELEELRASWEVEAIFKIKE